MRLRTVVILLSTSVLACGALAQPLADDNLSVNARFLVAARSADAAGIERGLAAGANVNSRNRLGESALVILLKTNKVDLAQKVLAAGADVNLAAVNGITPLMAAAFTGQAGMAKQLLDKGADVAALDRLQKNAMTYAAGAGSTEIVELLISRGVNPNAVYNNNLTALLWAAGFGKTAADMAREGNFTETAAVLDAAG